MAQAVAEPPAAPTEEAAAEETATQERREKVAMNLEAIMALPEVEARIAAVAAQAASQAVAQAMGLGGPAKTMQANVYDRFVTEANGRGDVLAHFRCDNAVATKIDEIDMALYESYLSGDRDRPTNAKGRPYTDGQIRQTCKTGERVNFVDGHCYVYTENQRRMLLWMRDQPPEKGGMPGIYEDHGVTTDLWRCETCTRSFSDRQTWEEHRRRTHGIAA